MLHRNKSLLFIPLLALISCSTSQTKEPVDYVNPYIGNISHLLVPTYTTVQLPNSMLRITPNRGDFTSETIGGFPLVQVGHRDDKFFTFDVFHSFPDAPLTYKTYDHELVTPYSYDVDIDDGLTHVSFAPSRQSAVYAVTTDIEAPLMLAFSGGDIKADGNIVEGSCPCGGVTVHFHLETQEQPVSVSQISDKAAVLSFEEKTVHLRYGISYISTEQAATNLKREISDYDIKAVAVAGRKIWNETLGRIRVEGGSEDDKTVFYTSYWRTLERPVCISEDGCYRSGYDGLVHEDGGIPFYMDDWSWDTFRAAHPLRILMDRKVEEAILESYLRAGEQDGSCWIPTFPGIGGDGATMNCNHNIISYADALAKGLNIDYDRAAEHCILTMREKSLVPWTRHTHTAIDSFFWERGYFPALAEGEKEFVSTVGWENRQPVPVTLGTSYDCWATARLAEKAGRTDDAAYFHKNSFNYRNIFNPETGFFHPKDSSGKFIPDFDYSFCGGMGGREYYDENNGWVYRWEVQHNIEDLVALNGGPEKFVAALDEMYDTPLGRSKFDFYAKYPDHTGNIGQFSMANEPSLHIPYLYNYAGASWKTQKRIRQLLETWFRNDLMGVPGDEDGGGMTSFVVFSKLGFYPVTPGTTEYSIGSPAFTKAEMTLENGKVFRIIAEGSSKENKYIQSATINGKPLEGPVLQHSDIMNGGCLKLVMGPRPNKELWR